MARLPRYPEAYTPTGEDLNLILSILDTGGVINSSSITNTGVSGEHLTPTTPNVSGSVSPIPGGAGTPASVKGLIGTSGIDNFSQTHTAYVILSWTPNPVSDFIARYDIYYHKGSDPTLYNLTVGGDVNLVRINNLFPATTYSFSVQAHDATNRASEWCPELNVTISSDADPPAVPTGLTATSTGTGVYLTWNEVGAEGISNDLKQYQVAVSLNGGATYTLVKTTGPGNSFFYTPTTAGQGTVFFKVATTDWTGNMSAYSSPVSAAVGTLLGPITINPGPLTVIGGGVGIDASPLETNTLSLNQMHLWSDVVPANGFQRYGIGYGIYWSPGGSNYAVTDVTFTQSTFTDENGLFSWNVNTGALSSPQTYAAWNALARRMILSTNALTLVGTTLNFTAATSTIIPGATQLIVRDNANANTNLSISNAGVVTSRTQVRSNQDGIVTQGSNAAFWFNDRGGAGPDWAWYAQTSIARLYNGSGDVATVNTSGDLALNGYLTLGGATTSAIAGPIVSGQTAPPHIWFPFSDGNVYFDTPLHYYIRTGGGSGGTLLALTSNQDVSINSTAGRLLFGVAASKIIPGATSLSHRNNADSADNLLITDAGLVTLRNRLSITGDFATIGDSLVLSSTTAATKGGALAFADAGTNKWEFYHHSDQSLNLWDFTRSGNVLTFNPNGGVTLLPDLSLNNRLLFTTASSKIIPGSTQLSLRNNADSADNLIISDAGTLTGRSWLALGGTAPFTPASGDLIVNRGSSQGAIYFGNSSSHYLYYDATNWHFSGGRLSVDSAGLDLGGSLAGATTGAFSSDVSIGGKLSLTTAASKIIPGATSLSFRNNGDSADNLLIVDAGDLTGRTKLTMPGPLVLTTGASKIVPGSTSLSLRNNADNADNLLVTDAGDATIRARLLFATAASKIIAGATSLSHRNNADSADNLLIADAGDLTGRTKLTMPGPLVLTTAASKIVPGATNISHRNNADSADNMLITDAGLVTLRNALSMPPSAGGTVAATSYGTVPVKINEIVTTAGQTSVSFTSIPSGFRHLRVTWVARDNSATVGIVNFTLQINNDTGANYTYDGNSTSNAVNTPYSGNSQTSGICGQMPQGGVTNNTVARGNIIFPNYTDAFFKAWNCQSFARATGGTTGRNDVISGSNFNVTAAINRIDFLPGAGNFAVNCVFVLEGIP